MKPGMSLIKHYLQFKDFRAEEYAYLFERARNIKQRFKNYEKYTPLVDRTLAMIFEKASTRTRVSNRDYGVKGIRANDEYGSGRLEEFHGIGSIGRADFALSA